jgi:hypothetical protein
MDTAFCMEALQEAFTRYGQPEICNTDQGIWYREFISATCGVTQTGRNEHPTLAVGPGPRLTFTRQPMAPTNSQARVTRAVAYRERGAKRTFPLGLRLLERTDGKTPEIICSGHGQQCALLSLQQMARAESDEDLVVLE